MRICYLSKDRPIGRWGLSQIRKKFPSSSIDIRLAKDKPVKILPPFSCQYDLIISLLCPWILKSWHLEKSRISVNFHPGPPEYPGFGCYNFALYNGETAYGVTAHLIDQKIDAGDIIGVLRFSLAPDETLVSLQEKSMDHIRLLFLNVMQSIKTGEDFAVVDRWARPATSRKEFESLRTIPKDASTEEAWRRIKAFDHPDFPGALVEVHGHRFVAQKLSG